jgi:N-acetyl sugar amidotransferase
MQTCTRCLYSAIHPLHILFDDEGVCSGCRVHEEKDFLDWDKRGEKLELILKDYRSSSGRNYDCIVPVSGARDSYFIVHTIKKVYGMNPLLVTYNKHYNTDVGIRNLANLRIKFDCDIMTQTINPEVVKKITRSTFRRFGSIYWHCLAGQSVFPVQLAVKLKIPLIIWGAHQGVDQVGMFSHLNEVEMTRKYRKEHDLMGYEAEDLIDDFDGIKEKDISPFKYPDSREIEQIGVRGIYLNNFIRWDSRLQHEKMIEIYGYETAKQTRTFDFYNDVDCWNYSDIHDYIKFIKYGYGKALDHACRDIRLGHITREDALDLVRGYSELPPKNLELFISWLGITKNAFYYVLDQHRNPDLWERDLDWNWRLRDGLAISSFDGQVKGLKEGLANEFMLTSKKKSDDKDDGYILIGKGMQ